MLSNQANRALLKPVHIAAGPIQLDRAIALGALHVYNQVMSDLFVGEWAACHHTHSM